MTLSTALLARPGARNAHVDALRGAAILCVLILHFALAFGLKNSPLGTLLPGWLLYGLSYNGNFGVTMFFVISGYLITSNALQRWGQLRDIDLRQFYLLRAARIMPCLLLALAIIVLLGSFGLPFFANTDGDHKLPASHFLLGAGSVLTFWHNVLMQSTGYFNYCLNIYWSLSVEEVFYLLLPLLCVLLRRTWLLVLVCLLAMVAGPLYRSAHLDNEIFYMYAYPACFDALAIGCLTALLARHLARHPARQNEKRPLLTPRVCRLLRAGSALLLAAVYLRGIDDHEIFGFSLIALFSACFLLGAQSAESGPVMGPAAARSTLPAPAKTGPLGWLGQHSYELYLFHIIVLGLMRNLLTKQTMSYGWRLPCLLLFLGLSCLLAWAIARWLSEPANAAIRRRFAGFAGRNASAQDNVISTAAALHYSKETRHDANLG